jgi:magnesium chelatase family protein
MYYEQPMEDGIISISRARGTVSYPAQFLLVSASNPCPCGYYGDAKRVCKCLPGAISRYQKRVSGPILDRIDIHVEVPSVETQKLVGKPRKGQKVKSSKKIQKGVQAARNLQTKRFKGTKLKANSEMSTKGVKKYCKLSEECRTMLRSAVASMNLTARSYFKVIKVARTIADLASEKQISANHLAEALQYRPKDDV